MPPSKAWLHHPAAKNLFNHASERTDTEKSNDKGNEAALLNQAKIRFNKKLWPYPIIQYLNGELTERAIIAPNANAQAEKQIFVGFRKLIQGKTSEALVNFRIAQNQPATAGSNSFVNYKKIATAMLNMLSR